MLPSLSLIAMRLPMLPGSFPRWSGFRALLGDEGADPRAERILAVARVFLSGSAFVAVYIDPAEPARFATVAYALLAAYFAAALAIVVALRRPGPVAPAVAGTVHGLDIVFAAAITFFTLGPNSPFFVLMAFGLMGAAWRWGLGATLETAAVLVGLLAIQAGVLEPALGLHTFGADFELELNRFVMRATYLMIAGGVLGYLGESARRLGAEDRVAAVLMGRARLRAGLRTTIQSTLGALVRLCSARAAVFAARERTTGRLLVWDLAGRDAPLEFREPDAATAAGVYWSAGRASVHTRVDERSGAEAGIVLDEHGRRLPGGAGPFTAFRAAHPCRSILSVPVALGDDWDGRLFLLDVPAAAGREEAVQFLQRLANQVSAPLYNVYLLHRLRAHTEAVERARLARELHDGITQTLISATTQVEVLRRQAASAASPLASDLTRVRDLLQHEVLNLRETMRRMTLWRVTPRDLVREMETSVDRFARDTGIAARFACDLGPEAIALAPRACREVARIVHEALVNVRRHSGASHVLVTFTRVNGRYRLGVEDDGCGFGFSGRRSLEELDAAREGPRVIGERARVIGASLVVESTPGEGARLEVSWPE